MSSLEITRIRDNPQPDRIGLVLPVDLRPLLGVWLCYDKNSTGIQRLEIDDWEGTPIVRVFGAGNPELIAWGEVPGAAFTEGVDSHHAVAFTATYHLNFVHVILAAYLNKRMLVVDAYSTFIDGNSRANYFQRDHLYLS